MKNLKNPRAFIAINVSKLPLWDRVRVLFGAPIRVAAHVDFYVTHINVVEAEVVNKIAWVGGPEPESIDEWDRDDDFTPQLYERYR